MVGPPWAPAKTPSDQTHRRTTASASENVTALLPGHEIAIIRRAFGSSL